MVNLGRMALVGLGILAYQNRDKIAAMVRRQGGPPGNGQDATNDGGDGKGLLERAIDSLSSGNGLADLLDRFRQSGNGDQADSWVKTGPNAGIEPQHVKAAIDPETVAELSAQTGLSEDELLRRLATDIPEAVDRLTPDGKLPASNSGGLLDDLPQARSA